MMILGERDLSFNQRSERLKPFPHILQAGVKICKAADASFPSHANPGIEICLVLKGEIVRIVRGRRLAFKAGDVSLTRPWEAHGGERGIRDVGAFAWVLIAPERFEEDGTLRLGTWCDLGEKDERVLGRILAGIGANHLGKMASARASLEGLFDELRNDRFGRTYRVNAAVGGLLVEVARRLSDPASPPAALQRNVARIINWVNSAPEENWTVAALAERAGVGQTTLKQWIRQATGLSPKQFILAEKINKIKELLAYGDDSITDIAFAMGFSSSQHLSDAFKKRVGMSPSAFRSAEAEKED